MQSYFEVFRDASLLLTLHSPSHCIPLSPFSGHFVVSKVKRKSEWVFKEEMTEVFPYPKLFGFHTYFCLSDLYMCAMSGTSGSSGFGSHSKEHMDNKTGGKKDKKISIYTTNTYDLYSGFS